MDDALVDMLRWYDERRARNERHEDDRDRLIDELRARASSRGVSMPTADDIRPRGTVQVSCAHPDCGSDGSGPWMHWVDALDPRLPDGPFLCHEHDPATMGTPMLKADA